MDDDSAEDSASRIEGLVLEDRAFGKKALGGGRGGRGGGKRAGGGGGGSGGGSKDVMLSKALSKLLRHQAQNAGIALDAEGYARLDQVLAWGPIRTLRVSVADVRRAVADSDKQRFKLKAVDGGGDDDDDDAARLLIRANQGHSIAAVGAAALGMTAIALDGGSADAPHSSASASSSAAAATSPTPTKAPTIRVPPTVVHGTYFAFWPAIVASGGLRPMSRVHVHCATGLPGGWGANPAAAAGEAGEAADVVSGMRRDAELLVFVDVERAIREGGMRWWMSDNGVVLTEGITPAEGEGDGTAAAAAAAGAVTKGLVPLKYFREVVGRPGSGVGVLWKDGEWVADLPEGLKIRVPFGKGGRGGAGGGGGRGRGGRGGGGRRGRG